MYYTDDLTDVINPPDDAWKPVYWTEMKNPYTLGDVVIEFVETFCTVPRGKFVGQKLVLADFQKWLIRSILELKPDGTLRYKEVYIQMPRKNGKSILMSVLSLFFGVKGTYGDQIFFAAKDSGQARILFDEMVRNIYSSGLDTLFKVNKDVVTNEHKNIIIKPLASSVKGAHGLGPSLAICDELHTWDSATGTSTKGQEMLDSLLTGSGDRLESLVVEITTAGSEIGGLAHKRYEKGKLVARGELSEDTFGFFVWEAEDHDDIFAPETFMKANPGISAGYMNLQTMVDSMMSASLLSTSKDERYVLNKWISHNEDESFIYKDQWRACINPDWVSLFELADEARKNGKPKPKVILGFDGSISDDSTGIVGLNIDTRTSEVLFKWEKDPTKENWWVDFREVDTAMRKCFELFDVKLVYLDPARYHAQISEWQNDFGRLIIRDIPQSVTRMAPMTAEYRKAILAEEVFHNGDARYEEHVLNAVMTNNEMVAKEKRNSPKKIDFLVCTILAYGGLMEHEAEAKDEARRRAILGI